MRTLRIEKLAELKKMATTDPKQQYRELASMAMKNLESKASSIDPGTKASRIDPAFVSTPLQAGRLLADEMTRIMESASINIALATKFNQIPLHAKITPNDSDFKTQVIDLGFLDIFQRNMKQVYSNLSSSTPSPATPPLKKTKRSSGGSDDKTAVIKQELWGTTVSDKEYKYIISGDGTSFQWSSADKSGSHKQGDSNWGKMVDNLNLIPPSGLTRNTGTPSAAGATNAPAPATTPDTTAATQDQDLVNKIARVLTVGMTTPLDIASGGNERKQITEMSNYLNPKGGVRALAAIIYSKVGTTLGQLNSADIATVNNAGQKELAVNRRGQFAADTAIIMRQVNILYRQFLNNKESLNNYFGKKSAFLDNKFVKAATLRRLKIRSQMEAAIDSSAQMGRARVS